jgi:hypothetical protein
MNCSAFRLSAVFLIAFSVIALLLAFLPAFAVQLSLFSDDFESGAGKWIVQPSTVAAIITDGTQVYSITNSSGGSTARSIITETTVPGSTAWTDYFLQARVKVVTGTQYGMITARYQDTRNYYAMALRADTGQVQIRRFVNNSTTATSSTVNGLVSVGTWYTAKLEITGYTLRAYIDGTPVLTYTDTIPFNLNWFTIRA